VGDRLFSNLAMDGGGAWVMGMVSSEMAICRDASGGATTFYVYIQGVFFLKSFSL